MAIEIVRGNERPSWILHDPSAVVLTSYHQLFDSSGVGVSPSDPLALGTPSYFLAPWLDVFYCYICNYMY